MAATYKNRGGRTSILVGSTGNPRGLRELAAQYLEWMKVRQYSPGTLISRENSLILFAQWCEERSMTAAHEITKPIMDRYQRHLFYVRMKNGKPLSIGTQARRLTEIRGLFRWLVRNHHLLYNPASEIDLPRPHKTLPHILTLDEVERTIAAPDISTPLGLRDRAMLEVLYSTGVRRKELSELKVNALDPEGGVLFVRLGKGMKDRVVPIGERAVSWITRYLNDARPKLAIEPDDGTIFLSATGRALDPISVSNHVREHLVAAGVTKKGACHLFRHAMATVMLENGAELRYIQEILGHENISTTQIYTHVSIRRLKEEHDRTHPAAKLARPSTDIPAAIDAGTVADLHAAIDAEQDRDDPEE